MEYKYTALRAHMEYMGNTYFPCRLGRTYTHSRTHMYIYAAHIPIHSLAHRAPIQHATQRLSVADSWGSCLIQ